MKTKIRGINHSALSVENLNRALEFYCNLLEATPYHVQDRDWAMVHWGENTLSVVPTQVHPPHLGLTVDSPQTVDLLYERLKSKNVPAVGKPHGHRDGSYGFYFKDFEGNHLECIYIPFLNCKQREQPAEKTAVVVVAHGSKDADWKKPLEKMLHTLKREQPSLHFELGFLESDEPRLTSVLEGFAKNGFTQIRVVPAFFSAGGVHMKQDLPQIVNAFAKSNPNVQVKLLRALGESERFQTALALSALEALTEVI